MRQGGCQGLEGEGDALDAMNDVYLAAGQSICDRKDFDSRAKVSALARLRSVCCLSACAECRAPGPPTLYARTIPCVLLQVFRAGPLHWSAVIVLLPLMGRAGRALGSIPRTHATQRP